MLLAPTQTRSYTQHARFAMSSTQRQTTGRQLCIPRTRKLDPESKAKQSERLTWPADVEGTKLPPAARAEELKRLGGTVNCS